MVVAYGFQTPCPGLRDPTGLGYAAATRVTVEAGVTATMPALTQPAVAPLQRPAVLGRAKVGRVLRADAGRWPASSTAPADGAPQLWKRVGSGDWTSFDGSVRVRPRWAGKTFQLLVVTDAPGHLRSFARSAKVRIRR
jgi:hypothetical protein